MNEQRLIDANAIKKVDLSGLIFIHPNDFEGLAKYFLEQLDRAPTVDPFIHAEWIWHEGENHCSNCDNSGGGKFCSECGAKMDKEPLTPRPPKRIADARWKGAGMGDYSCSRCDETITGKLPECPNCGAVMDV